jgi:alanine or glycine:cation symporter, AGCS family
MDVITSIIAAAGSFAWGPIMIVFLVGTGVFLSFRLKFIQFRALKHAFQVSTGKFDDPHHKGEISHFQALSTALSGTIGTGNIAGVATAIAMGGPGALFWMWITAAVGMCTKFCSCTLAVKYREEDKNGEMSGGPMYYLAKGLNMKWMGAVFAFFAMIASFGIGNMVQANSVAEPLLTNFEIPKIATGITMAVLVGLVIIGGIKRIGSVTSILTPFMTVVYVLGALLFLGLHLDSIMGAFVTIIQGAFTPAGATGGFAGATILQTIRFGVARGVFSNEAGLGSSPMAHAAARTDQPIREGLVGMIEPFIDTLCVCTLTGLVIVISGEWMTGVTGSVLSANAFDSGLPGFGKYIVIFGLCLFAFSTTIAWSYYGDRCARFLFGESAVKYYRWIYIGCIVVGATIKLELVWNLSDALNGLMAIPNLIALILLSPIVVKEAKVYFNNKDNFIVKG